MALLFNRRLANVLTMVRTYRDHTFHDLHSLYGRASNYSNEAGRGVSLINTIDPLAIV
jgi:hypothetical protein